MTKLDGWDRESSPFHAGEIAIQEKLGLVEKMDVFGRQMVRSWMPDQHRAFYESLAMIFVGHVDAEGWPWASVLAGAPGFVQVPDARTLRIASRPLPGDPLGETLVPGRPLGLVGLGLSNRRRNRVNGHIVAHTDTEITLAVDQAFGNCPQYIQTRTPEFRRDPAEPAPGLRSERLTGLDPAARDLIARADTFFVATSSAVSDPDAGLNGADVSHRGGKPGFVKVEGNRLTIPDYAGNKHFNTLGNILVNPKAGLLFIDYDSGDILMVTGRAEIVFEGPEVDAFRGAERLWRVTVDHAIRIEDAMPVRWSFGDFSANSLITGDWQEASARLEAEARRDEWRPYRVTNIVDESSVIRSFHLEPTDGGALFHHEAGQYLTLRVAPPGADKPVVRTYTLSSAPGDRQYRISVKREDAGGETPAVLVSTLLHATVAVGDLVEARAPRGDFHLDAEETRPAVLLAGGVGVTPMIAMARQVAYEALRSRHARPLTVFHAARTTAQRAFAGEFAELSAATGGAVRYISVIGRPAEGEVAGRDFDFSGRITPDLLRRHLALDDYDFFLCGPPAFMQAVYDMLRSLGARDARIFAEAFGPASLTRQPDETAVPMPAALDPALEAETAIVRFERSDFEQPWSHGEAPLLDLAEAHGLTPDHGCRNGSCGSCAVRLISGDVTYRNPTTGPKGPDEVLICSAVPAAGAERVVLDL